MALSRRQRMLGRVAPFTQAGSEARDYQLIAESGLFDRDWYLDFTPELDAAALDPLLHFLRTGAAAMRDPGPAFSMRAYLAAYPDVAAAGVDPLLHYLRHGRGEGRRPVPVIAEEPENLVVAAGEPAGEVAADGDAVWLAPLPAAGRAVVAIAHIYYPALWPVLARYLRNVPVPFDLIATLPAPADAALAAAIHGEFPDAAILATANRGRDLRPFLLALAPVIERGAALVCKVHTKLSRHRHDGSSWRREMLRTLLGSPAETQRILDAFARDPRLGLVGPAGHLLPLHGYFGAPSNAHWLRQLSGAAGIASIPAASAFVGGSMFWLRPEALAPALGAAFRPGDFDPERDRVDGTLAHGWERFIGVAVAAAGYTVADTAALSGTASARAQADARRDARHGPPRPPETAAALLAGTLPAAGAGDFDSPASRRRNSTPLSHCDAESFAAVDTLARLFDADAARPDRVFVHDDAGRFEAAPAGLVPGVDVFGEPCPSMMAGGRGETPARSAYSFACDGGVLIPESGVVSTRGDALVGVTIENAFHWGGIQFRENLLTERNGVLHAAWTRHRLPAFDGIALGGVGINYLNYGHFLFDGLPGIFLHAQALLGRGRDFRILVPPLQRWHRECFELAGLGAHLLEADGPVRCATLASTSLVSHHVDSPTRFCRPAFDTLRFAVARDPAAPERLFLARRGFMRQMRNAEAVEELLRRRGFTVAAPEALGVAGQIRLMSRARIVVGQTGAALANIVFAPPGARILEIVPVIRPDRWIRATSFLLGHVWHALFCGVAEADTAGVTVGGLRHAAEDFTFDVPLDRLDTALDAVAGPAAGPRGHATV